MSTVLTNEQFDVAFSEWERNRMYPQYYRKETAMETPNESHLDTLTRAQNHLEFDVNVANHPKLKIVLDRDIKRLGEIREMLLMIIENPTLPFVIAQPDSAQPILDQIADEPNGAF